MAARKNTRARAAKIGEKECVVGGAEVPAPKFGEATSDVELKKQSRKATLFSVGAERPSAERKINKKSDTGEDQKR